MKVQVPPIALLSREVGVREWRLEGLIEEILNLLLLILYFTLLVDT